MKKGISIVRQYHHHQGQWFEPPALQGEHHLAPVYRRRAAAAAAAHQRPPAFLLAPAQPRATPGLSEYYAILQLANPGYLGSLREFTDTYSAPIEIDLNRSVAERFRRITAPFLLRRLKTDKAVISDLPDKITTNCCCTLSPQQVALYQQVVAASRQAIDSAGLPRAARDRLVDAFQQQRSERILILSLKAGGTGLNLTAASHVIHYDLWWNPAVEAQATDRAFRIGQQRNVQVHRFVDVLIPALHDAAEVLHAQR